ncbi:MULTISPECIES: hydrogenase nickel incorporation protein HypB [Selenomonas]|uniref:Hydrogenase nickel incorporation protein HypB n=1 Tax=Selenomonas ruminis TaxID=2593411 RepID=A0A5D6WAS7_9FIRM|nr:MULTISPECIES: hydrogenase nickel incorporation protein HypB [unclassified Selenomonas]MBQ1867791.1 hydrogenase nickel incorporation protein HypB [Selenomonas sp.]TYZ24089.1 hydrogenase nickel incorporation protein HypB [Selenomonas sp. mPRGC5]
MAEIQVMKNILGENDRIAAENQAMFAAKGVYVVNLMGSPGAGKTSVLEKTMEKLKDELKMAVIEGDLFTSKDADRIERHGVPVIQINTAGGCHLDAPMVQKVAQQMDLDNLDLLIVENVGNLVCPAEFAVGEDDKAVVLSITEGDDKPLKYPLIFKESAIAMLNKVDILPYCNFNMESAKEDITTLHPGMKVLEISCTTGQGIDEWCDWLKKKVAEKKNG